MEIKRVPVSIYAESTPNPAVMKFVANKMLIDQDHVEFRNIEEAQPSPLAVKLFHFPFVKEVFISSNFVALHKFNVVEWDDVAQEIRQFLTDWITSGQPILTGPVAPRKDEESGVQAITMDSLPTDLGEIEQRIVEVLDEFVRPAVAQDGGNIAFVSYANKIVTVQLQGACSGCPSSTLTLQSGIKNILQRMLPTLIDDVVAA
jgi:Fe-S cluster biogenesis protein NfuA